MFDRVEVRHSPTAQSVTVHEHRAPTSDTVRMLPEQDRGTAEALRWAELSIAPMRERVRLIEGHGTPDGYVDEGSDGR